MASFTENNASSFRERPVTWRCTSHMIVQVYDMYIHDYRNGMDDWWLSRITFFNVKDTTEGYWITDASLNVILVSFEIDIYRLLKITLAPRSHKVL